MTYDVEANRRATYCDLLLEDDTVDGINFAVTRAGLELVSITPSVNGYWNVTVTGPFGKVFAFGQKWAGQQENEQFEWDNSVPAS